MRSILRRTLLAATAVAAFGGLLALPVQARSLADVKKSGTLVVATEGQFKPFNYFEGKELTGFEIDIANEAARRMGLKPEWKAISFDALLIGLPQDKWDLVIASHGINEERAKAVTFADPHYCTGGVIVSKGGAVKTAKDLVGKTVAVQVGTSYLSNVEKVAGIKEVKTFPQDPDAMMALAAGRVDAWVTDKFVAKDALAAKSKEAAGLQIGDFLFVERVAAAVTKGNTTLVDAYNAALKAMVADGTYAKLSTKWFGEDIGCK